MPRLFMYMFGCEQLYRAYLKRPYETWVTVHPLIADDYVRLFGLSQDDANELATKELDHRLNCARKMRSEGKKRKSNGRY